MNKKINIQLANPDSCTGCGACVQSCAKGAISMVEDREGFAQPVVDGNKCVGCGLCETACPIMSEKTIALSTADNSQQKGYAARNKDLQERLISSSGSVFPVLAKWVLAKKGLVIGVGYDEKFETEYKFVDSVEQLPLIQGSKYIQCRPDQESYRRIRTELNDGKWVLFTGLACQVEGLKRYLRKEYEKLICADLICMGIPSPMIWRKYLNWKFGGEQIQLVNFKEKSIGWNQFCFFVKTNRRDFREIGMQNQYLQTMFKTLNMRRSCFNCPFKTKERAADFTLADGWGINASVSDIDDNKGLSSVIIHSMKGIQIWKEIQSLMDTKELSVEDIVLGNSNIVENKIPTWNRRWWFYQWMNISPKYAFEFYGKQERQSIKKYKIKRILKKLLR